MPRNPAAVGKHYKHPIMVDREVFDQSKEGMKSLVQKRTRASFYQSLNQLESIAYGDAVSTSTSSKE